MADNGDRLYAEVDGFLNGNPQNPTTAFLWRQELRRRGQPALARALSRRLAEKFISGEAMSINDVDTLWKACKADELFSQARRILLRRSGRVESGNITSATGDYKGPSQQTLLEQTALMTSKDPDLAASMRHDWALAMLKPDLETSSGETLGIAGGILKRRWEWDGKISSLEAALNHYLAPVERQQPASPQPPVDRDGLGVTAEAGYPAINAAFICDLLAHRTGDATARRDYRARADRLRERIRDAVAGSDYWSLVTRAEALLGLGEIAGAHDALTQAAALQPDPWERETTARQLARLGALRDIDVNATRRVVAALLGNGDRGNACVESVLVGKVGLALSGGGFRASLYHLGVLARLAETDTLRHVQVLSCVSGGSMVGAAYYLRLRELLQTRTAPARDDYVRLVEQLIADFREGTSSNLRNSLLTDLETCYAVLTGNDRAYAAGVAGAIFRNLYSRTVPADPDMAETSITPAGADRTFHPKYHNIDRRAKVPALLLNATSLNTGHSWQFTASTMGESPFSIVVGADPLPRLRRSYYQAPDRRVTLSQAVAASACVPGLFAPLSFSTVFDDYDVRLVDGGVYDNQGALGLLQEDCTVIILSDACGQLGLQTKPDGGHIAPLLRANDIFQERMRIASYDRLRSMRDQGRLAGLAVVHLKKDLDAASVDWRHCEDPNRPGDQLPASVTKNPTTTYGVWKAHQERLAEIRTDLDVFSDIEAAALMASGYLAMDQEVKVLAQHVQVLDESMSDQRHSWFFKDVIGLLGQRHDTLNDQLRAGAIQFLRIAKLDAGVRLAVWTIGVLLLAAFGVLLWTIWGFQVSVGWLVLSIGGMLLPYVAPALGRWRWSLQLIDPVGAIRSRLTQWVGVLVTWVAARWLVPRMTRRYLDAGRLERLRPN